MEILLPQQLTSSNDLLSTLLRLAGDGQGRKSRGWHAWPSGRARGLQSKKVVDDWLRACGQAHGDVVQSPVRGPQADHRREAGVAIVAHCWAVPCRWVIAEAWLAVPQPWTLVEAASRGGLSRRLPVISGPAEVPRAWLGRSPGPSMAPRMPNCPGVH
jgi:hypothetical protein